MQWPDALGHGLFTASGAQLALDMTLPPIVVVLMGMVTAVFGGALRDHRPYAVCSFIGGWVLVFADQIGASIWTAPLAASATAAGLRMLALYTGYTLPSWRRSKQPRR